LQHSAERRWLLLPEFLLFSLGAEPVAEWTNATHTGLVHATKHQWDAEIFARAGLNLAVAPRIVAPGTVIGSVRGELAQWDAYGQTRLIAPACHDTASAVATMQCDPPDCAYIICGTWSLVGVALSSPLMSEEVRKRGFTNLGAPSGAYCFHTNINGMWMLKQCLEHWTAEGRASERLEFSRLMQQAEHADIPSAAIFPIDAAELLLPGDMPQKIRRLLRNHAGITLAESGIDEAAITRVILNSLAFRYAQALRDLEELTGKRYSRIRVLGGGARNLLLLRLIAESTGRTVAAGAVEASTLGNFALQMAADHGDNPPSHLLRPCVELCTQAEWLSS
jgi:rhamnulokinase